MSQMKFMVEGKAGERVLDLQYERVFAIGYAGRNMEKTMEHIKELEQELGVPAPRKIPTIFPVRKLRSDTGEKFGFCRK